MAAVALGSLLGTVVAHQCFPVRPSRSRSGSGHSSLAIIGYTWAIVRPMPAWRIGSTGEPPGQRRSRSITPALGVAGAILGYWISRQWRM